MVRSKLSALLVAVIAATVSSACSDPERTKQRLVERGDKQVSEQRYQEAIISYRNALKRDPKAGDVRHKLGDAYMQVRNFERALDEYERTADLLPANEQVQIKLGTLLLLGGRFEDARARATAVLKSNPRNVDAHILQANAMARMKDLDGAIAELEDAISLAPAESRAQTSLGTLQLAKGQQEAAEIAFKRAVELDPKSVNARLALATFYSATGRLDDAETALNGAILLDPKNTMANRLLATFYLSTRRQAEAEMPLKRIVETSNAPEARFALADFYLLTRRHEDARRILEPLRRDTATSEAASLRLASLEYTSGNREEAHRTLDALLERDAKHVPALVRKAQWLLQESRTEEALQRAKAAVAADPQSAAAFYTLGVIHASRHQNTEATSAFTEVLKLNPRAAEAQIHLARLSLIDGRGDVAVKYADEAKSNQPGSAPARVTLVRSLLAQNNLGRAESELKVLTASLPNDAVVQALNGTLQMMRKNVPAARGSFERALQLQAGNREAIAGLVALDFAAGRREEAVARIEGALQNAPNDPNLLVIAARAYGASGNLQQMEDALRRAVTADASYLPGYTMLGQLYLSQRRLDQARAEFETLARRQPDAVHAHTMVGVILQTQNKADEARKWYEQVVATSERAPIAANNLAYLYAESGTNLDMALQLAQSAKEQMPDNPDVNDTLGWAYYKKDLPALAIPPLEESVKRSPLNALYLFHLGLAYAKAGEHERARRALEQALKLQPDFTGADQARQTLASLKG